jgi:hypothetical protein
MKKNTIFWILMSQLIMSLSISAEAQKVGLPFGHDVDLSVLVISAEPLPSPAVPADKFMSGLVADCREFKTRIQKWKDQNVNVSDEIYSEIRTMPLALTMLEKFEINIALSGVLNTSLKNNISEKFYLNEVRPKINISFDSISLTPEKYRSTAANELELNTGIAGSASSIKFKSRDIFCDVLFGEAKLSLDGEVSMVPSLSFKENLQKNLTPFAEAFSIISTRDLNELNRAVLFGAALFNLQGRPDISLWQTEFEKNQKYLIDSRSLSPNPFWFLQTDEKVYVKNIDIVHLGLGRINLKLRGQNEK